MPDWEYKQPKSASTDLRPRAESILRQKSPSLDDVSKLSVEQMQSLIHELEVHQIELELQNEELRETQLEMSRLMDDFVDLYDMAPVGYLTVSNEGIILRANLTAAKLFGIDRTLLLKKPLSSLVAPEDRDKYYLLKIHPTEKLIQNTWQLRMIRADTTSFEAELKVAPIWDLDGNTKQFRLLISDITEISEAAREYHATPAILQVFIDRAPVAIAMFNNDMRYVAASRRWLKEHDFGDLEIIGRSHYEVFPGIPDRWKEIYQRCLSGETIRAEEDHFKREDGSVQWLRWEVKPWYKADKTIGGIIIFSEDITGLKESLVALSKSEQRLRMAQKAAKAGTWEWNLRTNENFWSDELWGLYGLEPNACTPSYETWAATINPDDRANAEKIVTQASSRGTELNAEWRVVDPDGSQRWLMCRGGPLFNKSGKPCSYLGIVIDITERKQTEESLHKYQEWLKLAHAAARGGAWEWNLATQELIWSDELWGLLEVDPYSCKPSYDAWYQTVHPDDRDHVEELVRKAITENADLHTEWRFNNPDGGFKYLMSRACPTLDSNGHTTGYIGFVMDITDRKLAEIELQYHKDNLEKLVGEKTLEIKRNQKLLQTIIDNVPAAINYTDIGGRYVFSNKTHQTWWRKTAQEINGKTVQEIMGDDYETARSTIESGLGGHELTSEMRFPYADGVTRDLLIKVVPDTGENGGINGMVALLLDITEVKITEQKLRDSELFFRSLFENTLDCILMTRPDGTIDRANPAACKTLGMSEEEICSLGRYGVVDLNDHRLAKALQERSETGYASGEVNFRKKNGTVFPVDLTTTIFSDSQGVERSIISFRDMTRRKQAEQELKDNEVRLRSYFEAPVIGVSISSPEKGWVEVNEKTCQMLGYSKQELYGMTWAQLTHPDDLAENLELFESLVAGEIDNYSMEKRFIRKTGDLIWVNISIGCVRHQDGSIKYVIAFIQDISDRKRLQQALEDNFLFVETLLEAIPCPIMYKNLDGKYLGCNRTFESYSGLTREQIIGKTVYELYPKDLADTYFQKDQELYSHPPIQIHENFFEHCDGTRRNVLFSKSTYDDSSGNVLGMIVVMIDITEIRKAEEALAKSEKRFKELAELLPQGVFEADTKGNLTFANTTFNVIHGFGPNDNIVGKNSLELIADAERNNVLKNIEKLEKGLSVSVEHVGRQRNGIVPQLLVNIDPIYLEDRVVGSRGVVTDITSLKQAERERKELQERLFQSQKLASLGILVGGIAHDFNNMLQVIIGYGEMLMNEINKGKADAKLLGTILDTSQQAADLVKTFMAMGQQSMVVSAAIDLNDKIREMKSLILHLPNIEHLNIDLVHEPTIIKQDPEQLAQVIMILATNASEAMPAGGRLSLTTSKVILDEAFVRTNYGAKSGPHILLTVTDSGRGIDEAIIPRIFDPFFSTKERCNVKGMGLGLSVVRGIVQQRGGFVTCESEFGKGAIFRVYFPEIETSAGPTMRSTEPGLRISAKTILVVEDNALVSGLEKSALIAAGYKTILAANGKEAVNIFKERHDEIGLVILDILMPEMNGRDCLMELLKMNPLVKAIVLSGHDPKSELCREIKPYVIGFLPKPCEMSRLVEVVQLVVDG